MITLDDCYGFCELDKDEVEAIAEHEQLPEIVALELAQDLIHQEHGIERLHNMIFEDWMIAKAWGNNDKALHYRRVLEHFDSHFKFNGIEPLC